MRINYLFLFYLALLSVFSLSAQEGGRNPIKEDRFLIEGGFFWVTRYFKIAADGEIPNEEIDFNKTFDLSESAPTYHFQFGWQFSKRWKASIQSFGVSAGDRAVLEEDLLFGNFVFKSGSYAEGGVRFDLLRLYFDRKVFMHPHHEISVGIGVHGVNIEAFIEGEAKTSEGDTGIERVSFRGIIPLPNIGFSYVWYPHQRWMLGATVNWFGLTIDEYSGGLWNFSPRIKFQFIDNFGMGLDYRFFSVDAEVRTENWKGRVDLGYSGPLISIHGNF